ncbi:MAG TPA: S8/S53 family peptidase [Polyangiaceae bacterium]|nr:S8/S53 family peptidase [Polyangiaceae bacterium]
MTTTTTDPESLRAAERRADPRGASLPGEVVDCGRWLAQQPVPRCPGIEVLEHAMLEQAGAGIRIALLDAPADLSHPDLRGAAITRWPGVSGLSLREPTAHGTASASLLVGQGVAQVRGVAPAAELLLAPVLRTDGTVYDELVARALAWAVSQGADVVVLPFGRRRLGRRVATRVRVAVVMGVRVVAAAGSLGPDLMTFPGSVSGVLAVTGHDGNGRCPECSARADLAAPGLDVPAAGPYGLVRMQGSAPAAVLAAGSLAVRLSAGVETGDRRGEAGQRDVLGG